MHKYLFWKKNSSQITSKYRYIYIYKFLFCYKLLLTANKCHVFFRFIYIKLCWLKTWNVQFCWSRTECTKSKSVRTFYILTLLNTKFLAIRFWNAQMNNCICYSRLLNLPSYAMNLLNYEYILLRITQKKSWVVNHAFLKTQKLPTFFFSFS